jgi:adenosyl cobinamide kinase/adenosyl cobinamide phosphate guanylyltransferase
VNPITNTVDDVESMYIAESISLAEPPMQSVVQGHRHSQDMLWTIAKEKKRRECRMQSQTLVSLN